MCRWKPAGVLSIKHHEAWGPEGLHLIPAPVRVEQPVGLAEQKGSEGALGPSWGWAGTRLGTAAPSLLSRVRAGFLMGLCSGSERGGHERLLPRRRSPSAGVLGQVTGPSVPQFPHM